MIYDDDDEIEAHVFKPHSLKQEDLIFSEANLTVAGTGTQWGKSQAGTLWMQRQIFDNKDPKANFIIASPSYKIMQQSILPYFLTHIGPFGHYSKVDATFKFDGGGTVYFRTETDPDSIVGIPNVKAGWIDEAGKIRLYFWENYRARAAAKGAKTLLTTSPYTLNWLYKDIIKPKLNGKFTDNEVTLIQAASWENPYHSLYNEEVRKKEKDAMDARRFNMIYGGEWGNMVGLVYDCFDEDMVIPAFTLPTGTVYYAGIDWGYTDPFVLVVRAITPSGHHFQVSEFVKTQMTITDIIEIARQKHRTFGIKHFYAGPDQPGYIEEFNRNGLPCIPADNDIRRGVDKHYELIKSDRYQIFQGTSPYTLDEMATYHYPEPAELKPDQSSKEQKPVGQDDHCMDANRYCTIMTCVSAGQKHVPKVPSEQKDHTKLNHEKRIEYLKKKNRTNKGYEKWS